MKTSIARIVAVLVLGAPVGFSLFAPSAAFGQLFQRSYPPCVPCPTLPQGETGAQPGQPGQPGAATQPGTEAPQPPAAPQTSPADLFAQVGEGAAGGPQSAAPNMVGDYLGGFTQVRLGGTSSQVPLPGGAIPRFKMAEDTSPLPTTRVFFNYDYYSNVPINNSPASLNGYTPGFEMAFLCGAVSVEMRLPMASTLGNNISLGGANSTDVGEVGNLGIAVKALLVSNDTFALSAGLGINTPTAADTQISSGGTAGITGLQISNQSVHLLPFVGGLWTPNDRLFCMGFMQFDIDANGDAVSGTTTTTSTYMTTSGSPTRITTMTATTTSTAFLGRYCEQTMLYLDGTVGYWILHNDDCNHLLTGVALFGELHADQSLTTTQSLAPLMAGNNISILDMTGGADFQIGKMTTLTTAYCIPLTADRDFNGQFRCLLNYRF